jgi:N-acetylglucosamine malate deacetylase 1
VENPDAIFTHWLIDNHPDHRATANLTYESWKQLKPRFALYYYEVSDGEDTNQFPAPTHYVDITEVADRKKAACYAHASQSPDFYYGLQDYRCDIPRATERVQESGSLHHASRKPL